VRAGLPDGEALFAVDDCAAFSSRAPWCRPSKSFADLEVSSVKKKLKDKAFARGVQPGRGSSGCDELGVPLDEHIAFCIQALRPVERRWASEGESRFRGRSIARLGATDSRQRRPTHRGQHDRSTRSRDDRQREPHGPFRELIIRATPPAAAFATAWAERARAGVRVRILYDAFGSLGTSRAYWRELRNAGVDVRPFRPIWTSGPIAAFSRDHRKLLVVDGERAMTGGLCIGDEWAGNARRRDRAARHDGRRLWAGGGRCCRRHSPRMWRAPGVALPDDEIAPAPEECGPFRRAVWWKASLAVAHLSRRSAARGRGDGAALDYRRVLVAPPPLSAPSWTRPRAA